jgi:mRNA interferase MazF
MEHPELGRRPACILTRETAVAVLNSVLVAPATTKVRGIPTEVALTRRDGVPTACALSFDNLETVPKSMLVERITRVPERKLPELCDALRAATGC